MQGAQDNAGATAWGAGYSHGSTGRPQSWPSAETLPDYEAGHAAGTADEAEAIRLDRLVTLTRETMGSRRHPRTLFIITARGEYVGYVEAETSGAVRGVMLRGEPFGRYGSRIRDHSIETLTAKRSERLRLCRTIRRHLGLPRV